MTPEETKEKNLNRVLELLSRPEMLKALEEEAHERLLQRLTDETLKKESRRLYEKRQAILKAEQDACPHVAGCSRSSYQQEV